MTERSYFWSGTATGDASIAPYDSADLSNVLAKIFERELSNVNTIDSQSHFYIQNNTEEFINYGLVPTKLNDTYISLSPGCALVRGRMFINVHGGLYGFYRNGYHSLVIEVNTESQIVGPKIIYKQSSTPALIQTSTIWQVRVFTVIVSNNIIASLLDQRSPISHVDYKYRKGGSATTIRTLGDNVYSVPTTSFSVGNSELSGTTAIVNYVGVHSQHPVVVGIVYSTTSPTSSKMWIKSPGGSETSFYVEVENATGVYSILWMGIG